MPRVLLAFEPPDGGVAENVMRLALGLSDHGFEPWLAGPEEAVVYPPLEEAGLPIARLPFVRGYGRPAVDARALRRLTAILARGDFDLMHVHSAKAGVLGRIAAPLTRTPVVYSPHSFPFVGEFGTPRRIFATTVERMLGPATDHILCVADYERRLALEKKLVPGDRLTVVHNGSLPCPDGVEPAAELAAFASEGPLAAAIAVLRPQKSVDVFVDAAPLILEQVPEARLAVVGNGYQREELEQRASRLGIGPRLRFFDFTPPAAQQLKAVDVFVLPSSWEAFPISILEAMACGVPQVATDVGGTGEATIDGQTGLLCPPRDPPALAAQVVKLLQDPNLRELMGAAARARHEQEFGVDTMVAKTAALYRRVLAAKRPT